MATVVAVAIVLAAGVIGAIRAPDVARGPSRDARSRSGGQLHVRGPRRAGHLPGDGGGRQPAWRW